MNPSLLVSVNRGLLRITLSGRNVFARFIQVRPQLRPHPGNRDTPCRPRQKRFLIVGRFPTISPVKLQEGLLRRVLGICVIAKNGIRYPEKRNGYGALQKR